MPDNKSGSGNTFGFDFTFNSGGKNKAPQTGNSPASPKRIDPSSPMRILIIADFSNLDHQGSQKASVPRIERIDIDNFDEILERKNPAVSVSAPNGMQSNIKIREMDDFHPDQLFTSLPLFEELRNLRERLDNQATFEEAAAKLTEVSQAMNASDHSDSGASPDESNETPQVNTGDGSDSDLIASMLASDAPTVKASAESTVSKLIESIVAPHIVEARNPLQSTFVSSVDTSIGEQVRNILHNPVFQSLEARWRALHSLVINSETDENLQLHILDLPKSALDEEISYADKNPEHSPLARLMSLTTDQGDWSAIVTDLAFTTSDEDVMLLGTLGRLAQHFNAPLLANAKPELFGCQSSLQSQPYSTDWNTAELNAREYWQNLRSSGLAPWISLAAPRFLARLPYGKTTDPAYEFEFEEIDTMEEHERFLWGPASFCSAILLAQSFSARGWSMNPDDNLSIEDLPAITFSRNGEKVLMPCAELNLGESSATEMLLLGVMPLLSYSNRNTARFMRFQSIANPPQPLAGAWS